MTDQTKLNQAKKEHLAWLQEQPGFQGVGIGVDASARACLKVFSNKMTPETRLLVEQRLSDVIVEFEETGPFRT